MFSKSLFLVTLLSGTIAQSAFAEIVTFVGSGIGPFQGEFGNGTITAVAGGSGIVPGSRIASPDSNLFSFASNQIIGITDNAETGAFVEFSFSGVTFAAFDYLFITSVGGESDITLTAKIAGLEVDADWIIAEAVGTTLSFDDDGAGITATISGTPNQPGGLLLQSTVSGIDKIIVSWTGNGIQNRGLQLGVVAVPEPSTFFMAAFSFSLFGLRRRSSSESEPNHRSA